MAGTAHEILTVTRSTDRGYQVIREPDKVAYVLREYIQQRPLSVTNSMPVLEVFARILEDGVSLELKPAEPFEFPSEFSLYVTLNKQMELDVTSTSTDQETTTVLVREVRISTNRRTDRRLYPVPGDIFASEFLISKNKMDLNPLSFSVSNRVIFHEFERKQGMVIKGLQIRDFEPGDESTEKVVLKKTNTGFLVTDIADPASCEPLRPEFADLRDILKSDLWNTLRKLQEKGIRSWLMRPLMYTNMKGERFPIAAFIIRSQDRQLSPEDYDRLAVLEEEIVRKIKDANLVRINDKMMVLNVGTSGCCLEVPPGDLRKYLDERKDMTLNVTFRMQSPMRFYGVIKTVRQDKSGRALVSLGFEGLVNSNLAGVTDKETLLRNIQHIAQQGGTLR